MSLLRRVPQESDDQTANTPNTPQNNQQAAPARKNPFGGPPPPPQPAAAPAAPPPLPGRFAASSSNNAGNSGSNSPFGSSLRNRLNNAKQQLEWTVTPLHTTVVRFQLKGLGDPFHRLLGTDLNVEFGDPVKVVQALQDDEALSQQLEAVLDKAWESYGFEGAAMLHPATDVVKKAFLRPPQPVNPPPQKDEEADDDDDKNPFAPAPEPERSPYTTLRAIDMAFILNVLGRTRSQVVVAGTPLALEPGFLERTFITDDPRLVALAQATGCIDETW